MSLKLSSSSRLKLDTPITISIEPVSNSVFAGEPFECYITFSHACDGELEDRSEGRGHRTSANRHLGVADRDSTNGAAASSPDGVHKLRSTATTPKSAIRGAEQFKLVGRSNSPTLLERQRRGLGWPADEVHAPKAKAQTSDRVSHTASCDQEEIAGSKSSGLTLKVHPVQSDHETEPLSPKPIRLAPFLEPPEDPNLENDHSGENHVDSLLQRQERASNGGAPYRDDAEQQCPVNLALGFAQFSGSFLIDDALIQTDHFDTLRERPMYTAMGADARAEAAALTRRDEEEGIGRIFKMGSDWLGLGTARKEASAIRAAGGGGGSILSSNKSVQISRSQTHYPVFSGPPTILFSDLKLLPGSKRRFHYTLPLPADLPPSHRGQVMTIRYSLSAGVHFLPGSGPKHGKQKGKILDIPLRIFNNVSFGGIRLSYDLLNPIVLFHDSAMVTDLEKDREKTSLTARVQTLPKSEEVRDEMRAYLSELLLAGQKHSRKISSGTHRPTHRRHETLSVDATDEEKEGSELAIDLATSSSPKASYELAQNGKKLARLTLPRSNYKLGESITGFLELNVFQIPVYQVSISLTSHEIVQSNYQRITDGKVPSKPQVLGLKHGNASRARLSPELNKRFENGGESSQSETHGYKELDFPLDVTASGSYRRTYAQHDENTLSLQETGFTLSIPTNASPDFTTTGLKHAWFIRFEFLTGRTKVSQNDEDAPSPKTLVPFPFSLMQIKSEDSRHQIWQAQRDLEVELFECNIPIRVYPHTGKAVLFA